MVQCAKAYVVHRRSHQSVPGSSVSLGCVWRPTCVTVALSSCPFTCGVSRPLSSVDLALSRKVLADPRSQVLFLFMWCIRGSTASLFGLRLEGLVLQESPKQSLLLSHVSLRCPLQGPVRGGGCLPVEFAVAHFSVRVWLHDTDASWLTSCAKKCGAGYPVLASTCRVWSKC